MTTDTVLSETAIGNLMVGGDITNFEKKVTLFAFTYDEMLNAARAIEQAVLQSYEAQELRSLLKEARQQLPLAAQFWNEDDDSDRGSRNVGRVMELIAKIDAAMEKKP